MRDANPNTSKQYPYNIHSDIEATGGSSRTVRNVGSEWPQGHLSQLKRLQPEGNTYYRQHQQEACHEVFQSYKKASEDKPDYITETRKHNINMSLASEVKKREAAASLNSLGKTMSIELFFQV
jgi:hypothetical protein